LSTVYSVFQISNYIKNMFRQDILLSGNVSVQGEVSNCKDHSTGLYFTLKDDKAVISCVMFRSAAAGLAFSMRPGDKVTVTGYIDTYPRNGSYQLYAKKIEKSGTGELYEKFLKLKEELEEMGMFDSSYKKPVPSFAQKIGIVTAPTGAVIQDIRNVSRRRHPGVSLFLYPSLVQGPLAAGNIVRGIQTLDRLGLDIIIVGRGGGSLEDLWAFNEEIVARAIFDADTPIISAVGHETDWTIADFVADLRAPTPSAAAELAVPDFKEILVELQEREDYLGRVMSDAVSYARMRLDSYKGKLAAGSPSGILKTRRSEIDNYRIRLNSCMMSCLDGSRRRLTALAERLEGASPVKRLTQGYSFVEDSKGRTVDSVEKVNTGDELTINVTDGVITASVRDTCSAEPMIRSR